MLVWDHLAQFVTVATAEWFDVLPLFKGNLIRNFIYQDAVSTRLFTLLAFIHLGAPFIMDVIAWVHIQRVPRTRARRKECASPMPFPSRRDPWLCRRGWA